MEGNCMASVFNRGTKDKPRLYYKIRDVDDVWRMRPALDANGEFVRTRAEAKEIAKAKEAEVAAAKKAALHSPMEAPVTVGDLIPRWLDSLTNRNAHDDRTQTLRHVLPRFKAKRADEIDVAEVLQWVNEMKATKLSPASQRKNLNLLSRFFGWCVVERKAQYNPVRNLPQKSRPKGKRRNDRAWIDDDTIVRKAMQGLPFPLDAMFYLANRSGMRPGELWGLRLSDLAFMDQGIIRVRYSYDGCLKEDKDGTGDKVKDVPCPDDAHVIIAPIIARRRAEGAGPEDVLFPRRLERDTTDGKRRAPTAPSKGGKLPDDVREQKRLVKLVDREWAKVRKVLGLGAMTFYEASRHSAVSRNLSRGVSLDDASAGVGHHSPQVTKQHYAHFVRKSFPATMRQGLGLKPGDHGGKVLAFPAPAPSAPQHQADPLESDGAGGSFGADLGAATGQAKLTTGDPTGN
jgi:integrase